MQTRLDGKLTLLYTLLVLQVLIVMIYVATTPPPEYSITPTRNTVSFVKFDEAKALEKVSSNHRKVALYRTINDELILKESKTQSLFKTYNQTLCWKMGVDDRKTSNSEDLEKCVCNQGWHGSDCGQPEVVWRAIMASKQNVRLERRKSSRRIIYTFFLNEYNSAIVELIVEELYGVVDLFVVCDFDEAEDNFEHKLSKGLLRAHQRKILYVSAARKSRKPSRVISRWVWDKIKSVVKNLRDDDIHVISGPEQILNSRALMFLKVYDGWPQPIGFRLRWSVYGFFWQHPLKTVIALGACTVGLINDARSANSIILQRELAGDTSTNERRDTLGLVIGDLNHYGGWYCYMCQTPANIITGLRRKTEFNEIPIQKTLDVPFVEDLIGTGVWLDGKTNLLRVSKSHETYFAPETTLNNTWKYDWLVENFYAKLDYY